MIRLGLSTLALAALLPAAALAGNGNTVDVCHVSGNGSINTLSVNQNAIGSHLAHGDFLPLDWFLDADGDGYGDGTSTTACEQPAGFAGANGDCDDADAAINPGATEVCDGIDNDCDTIIDPDCFNWGDCQAPVETTECIIDMATGGAVCSNGNPTSVVSTQQGLVLRLDMTDWTVVAADLDYLNPTGYSLNIGNSPSNNGWDGDGSQFFNDSEVQMLGNTLGVFLNDAHNGWFTGVAGVDVNGDLATAVVCDSYFGWESSVSSLSVSDARIFQIDGDESDPQAGGLNDTILWLGINRVIGGGRVGSGLQNVTLTFGR